MTSWCSVLILQLFHLQSSTPRRLCFMQKHIASVKSNYNGSRYNILSFTRLGFSRLTAQQINGLQRIRGKICVWSHHIWKARECTWEPKRCISWHVSCDWLMHTLQGCESCDRLLIPIIMQITDIFKTSNSNILVSCRVIAYIFKHLILNVHIRASVNHY